jgi:hypothetical protein
MNVRLQLPHIPFVIVTHYPLKFCAIWPTSTRNDIETRAGESKKALKKRLFVKISKLVKKMCCPVRGITI